MSILATDKKLISFGTDYSAGSGISIIDHTISIVPSAVGKTYSAGPNIDIYQQDDDYYISGKDWSNEIANASSNSYTQSTSYFNNWINGQYTGDITNIKNNLTSLSGDLSSYYKKTETSSKEQISDAIQYVSAHAVGDVEVNNYVHNNSATIDEVNSAYKANSASYITAHQSLEGYATEEWVESKGYITGVNLPESATWNEASNVVSSNSAKWSEGKTYEGVSPIVVNNNENKISADTWTLSAGSNVSFVDDNVNKITRIDVDLSQQDLSYISAQVDSANQGVNSLSSSLSLLSSTVNTNSGTWNETSNVVQTNSAQWAEGGGGSVSSKYGTISVDGSNIEATNKAIEFKSNGFNYSFDDSVVSSGSPVVLTWDNYSQETTITANGYNESPEDATLTFSSNTNVTGEVAAASYNTFNIDLQIPNATAIQFTSDKNFRLMSTRVYSFSSFKISELAWKSDLPTYSYNSDHRVSAINGNELVGNEDYLLKQGFVQNLSSPKGTISVLNNNKIEGTNSAIASDVIEGFVSSYNVVSVYPGNSATLTWDRYVPNTMLFVSGAEYQEHTLTYSANTDVTGVITTTTAGQISIELPTDSTSIVIGNENWSNINYNFTVSADNYYEIGELAWASAIPTYEYDSTNKISAINGSAIGGGSEVPSGSMNVSGLEYNAVNEISAYNGSAIAQYGAEKQWLVHDDTIVSISNSAQYAFGCNISALQRLMGIDETVLWEGTATSLTSLNMSESLDNFKMGRVIFNPFYNTGAKYSAMPVEFKDFIPLSTHKIITLTNFTTPSRLNIFKTIFSYSGNQFNVESQVYFDSSWNSGANNDNLQVYKIVGIGRKA